MAVQGLDAEPAVGRFQGPGAAVHHHGGHDVALAGVGDVEGLHPLRRGGQVQHLSQQGQGVGHPLLGGGGPLRLLGGVPLGHSPQVRLLAPLGDVDPDLVSRPLRQDLGQVLAVARVHGQQDLMGQDGPGQVVLSRQGGEHLRLALLHGSGEQLRLPARQIAVLHVQNGVAALAGPPADAPDIRVRAEPGDNGLLLAQSGDGVDAVPQRRRLLEPQGLRLRLHLGGHLPQELLALSLQQLAGLADAAVVLLRRHLRTAEAVAPAHVEIQAGPLRPDVPGELAAAGGQPQRRAHGVQGLTGLKPAAEGAEILRSVVGVLVHHGEAGIGAPGQPDKGVALVVLQQDVVAGHMPLDEGVFQHQGLKLAGDENGVEPVHLGHHLPGLDRVSGAVLEILAHPVFQFFRLAHINDPAGLVHHQIDAGSQGQVIGLFPQFVLGHGAHLPSSVSQ